MGLMGLTGAIGCLAVSGVPGLFMSRRSPHGQRIAVAMVVMGSAAGLTAATVALATGAVASGDWPGVLAGTRACFRLDALSAFFLMPVFLIGAAGSIYGLGYWRQAEHPRTAAKLQLYYGILLAAMAGVTLAADGVSFLLCWEVMALSAFFLVDTEDQKREVREASWLYLVCTHVGTLFLIALFALLRVASGSFEFRSAEAAGPGLRIAIFLTALAGFGLKAGMMPLHFWLPSAHANAPSHVSALLSGVMLKIGIYGLLRTLTLFPNAPAAWGGLLLLLGTASAILGVLFALGQHDLKRLLAYHSIENIGIILMGVGLALVGHALGRPDWMALGLAGCLLHIWNHSLFKSLLFFAAGSTIHAVRTREIDRMGGIGRLMPRTAALFFLGAAAICGLPPLNGFVSELFIYLGLFRTLDGGNGLALVALAAPCLAFVGALALACFVKAYGAVFLGVARTPRAARAHESSHAMTAPMAALALGCAAIGVVPALAVPALHRVIAQWGGGPDLRSLAPLGALTAINIPLAILLLAAFAVGTRTWLGAMGKRATESEKDRGRFFPLPRSTEGGNEEADIPQTPNPLPVGSPARPRGTQPASSRHRHAPTWDCGYAASSPRMQYTASSFAQAIVNLFRGVLRPSFHEVKIDTPFPASSRFESHVGDVVLDRAISPGWRGFRSRLASLRVIQQGSVQRYVLYILIILLLLLLIYAVPFGELLQLIRTGGQP